MEIHFAPLQGYADAAYRRLHAGLYGGVDCYYTPFIRVEKGEPRRRDISQLQENLCDGLAIVPQIIFNSVEEFDVLTAALRNAGVSRIDLNLGCPYPMQTRHGRGAAMIADVETMARVAERIKTDTSTTFSVKMRLGLREPDEWRQLMPILNSIPLVHIAVHPRTAGQMYDGNLHEEQFAAFLEESANPVIWNGEIHTPADIHRLGARYPSLRGMMIGRGLLSRPSLAAEYRSGTEIAPDVAMSRLRDFHNRLLAHYEATLCGPVQILQKIKPFWEYAEPTLAAALGEGSARKFLKGLRKAGSIASYRRHLSVY